MQGPKQPESPLPLPQPLSLTGKQRIGLGIAGGLLAIGGLYSLLLQLQNGIATLAVILAGAFFLLIAAVGQLPGTIWTRFAREATDELQQLRALRSQLEEDEVMRIIAQVATAAGVKLAFGTGSHAFRWPAAVTYAQREVGILYVGSESPLPDYFAEIVEPSRPESAVLVIFNDAHTQEARWSIVKKALGVTQFDLSADPTHSPSSVVETQLSVCGTGFADVYAHLDTLVFNRIGGSQQTTELISIRPSTA